LRRGVRRGAVDFFDRVEEAGAESMHCIAILPFECAVDCVQSISLLLSRDILEIYED
jgi:hypothetical protein